MNYNQKEVVSTPSNYVRIIFSLAVLLLSSLNISAQCNRRNDSLELVKLYNATDGPNWKKIRIGLYQVKQLIHGMDLDSTSMVV
jgi:hypothetical protein